MARALVQPGCKTGCGARQGGVKDQTAVRRVVVGDQDDRSPSLQIAGVGHHIPGAAVGHESAAKPEASARDLVPDRGRADCGGHRSQRPGAQSAAARGERTTCREQVGQRQRPPVAAVGSLLLDARLRAVLPQARGDRFGRPPFAFGGRRSLETGQFPNKTSPAIRFAQAIMHRPSCITSCAVVDQQPVSRGERR